VRHHRCRPAHCAKRSPPSTQGAAPQQLSDERIYIRGSGPLQRTHAIRDRSEKIGGVPYHRRIASDSIRSSLDLGKFKSVAAVMNATTRRHAFATLDTTPQALHELLTAHAAEEPSRTLVVVECRDAAGWVADLAMSPCMAVKVANCHHEAWRWNKVKRKTERDDALKLAKMALNDELPTVHVPSPQKRQQLRLILHRRALVARRTQLRRKKRTP
jgi:hypothetical protein